MGYCPLPYVPGTPGMKYQDIGKSALPAQVPCHKAHWKRGGHKQECARFAAEAKAAEEAAEAAKAEAAKAGAAGGGGGGKKGGKKGKKNRRR